MEKLEGTGTISDLFDIEIKCVGVKGHQRLEKQRQQSKHPIKPIMPTSIKPAVTERVFKETEMMPKIAISQS